jgi:hypothetical protein
MLHHLFLQLGFLVLIRVRSGFVFDDIFLVQRVSNRDETDHGLVLRLTEDVISFNERSIFFAGFEVLDLRVKSLLAVFLILVGLKRLIVLVRHLDILLHSFTFFLSGLIEDEAQTVEVLLVVKDVVFDDVSAQEI